MDTLIEALSYPFVRYALIVGVLVALCSSLLGVILVLKRFSYIGDGLSHVAFGAMAIAAVVGLTDQMVLTLPITIVCAILLLWTGQNAKIKGDAAIAMISVGALAFGYLLMNLFPTSSNISGDVCSSLFGSTKILTLTKSEVILSIVLSVVVVILFVIFYNRFFAVTFDESFAKAVGTKTRLLNLLIATVIAVIIVLAMNLVNEDLQELQVGHDLLGDPLGHLCTYGNHNLDPLRYTRRINDRNYGYRCICGLLGYRRC